MHSHSISAGIPAGLEERYMTQPGNASLRPGAVRDRRGGEPHRVELNSSATFNFLAQNFGNVSLDLI